MNFFSQFKAASLGLTLGLAALNLDAQAFQIPSAPPLNTEEAKARFLKSMAYSYYPSRTGDLFFLPRENYFVTFATGDYAHDGWSHFRHQGQIQKLPHGGSSHGMIWDYDVHIPLLFYGPGFVHAGQQIDTPATQQDLVPTYAKLIGATPPEDALHGKVLTAPFKSMAKKPKVIVTLVFDQGGWQYYRQHPQATPNIMKYMEAGSLYTQARISHLDVETSVGHIAIGSGAYPYQHGIVANSFFIPSLARRSSLLGPDNSPIFIDSSSLADVWDLQQKNQAIILSYAYASRAAIGMAGHGSMHTQGDKDIVVFYESQTGQAATNDRYYTLPEYLKDLQINTYRQRLLKGGKWWGHTFKDNSDINGTTAQVWFDGDLIMRLLENEPLGQDDVTDLVYLTLKATDACAHAFGYESEECREVFSAQDEQTARIINYLEQKVGRDQLLFVITADHGGTPLTTLSGGERIMSKDLVAYLSKKLDKLDNGIELIQEVIASQIYINQGEMVRNQISWREIQAAMMDYRLKGEPVFLGVWTRQDIVREQLKQGLIP